MGDYMIQRVTHRCSQYHLIDCTIDFCILSSGRFKIKRFKFPNFVDSYYILETDWQEKHNNTEKVALLGRIDVSPTTGRKDVVIWQPEMYSLGEVESESLFNECFEKIGVINHGELD